MSILAFFLFMFDCKYLKRVALNLLGDLEVVPRLVDRH